MTSSSLQILVVDDDAHIRELVSAFLLTEFRCQALVAVDGLDAFIIAQQKSLDLIITDLQMPFMDGWQFIQALRGKQGPNRLLPVILFSGFLDAIDIRSHQMDDVHFMPKPLKADSFLRVCRTLLASHLRDHP